MQVTVRLIGAELPSKKKIQTVELGGGDTVETALETAFPMFDDKMPLERMKKCAMLLNNKRAYLNDTLKEGDHIQVLRTLEGG